MAATVTEIQETNGAVVFAGAGWATTTIAGASGGTFKTTTGVGNTCTVSFTGRAIYLLATTIPTLTTVPDFTAAIDGVAIGGNFNLRNQNSANPFYRVLIPLASGLTDGAHTLVITNAAQTAVDSLIVVSGTKTTPKTVAPGALLTVGDSWAVGTGATIPANAYVHHLRRLLSGATRQTVVLTNAGVGGACLHTNAGGAVGGMYALVSNLATVAPQYTTVLFGANDLNNTDGHADFTRHIEACALLIEDVLDVAGGNAVYAIATPPYQGSGSSAAATNGMSGHRFIEQVVAATRYTLARFPLCRVANIYEALGRDGSLMQIAGTQYGLHPNDIGHGVVGQEFVAALLGETVDVVGGAGGSRFGGR